MSKYLQFTDEDADITLCPDGKDHQWLEVGEGAFPDGQPSLISRCLRCNVGSIQELTEEMRLDRRARLEELYL